MKIILFSVLDGVDNIGMRKVGAFIKTLADDVEILFLVPGQHRSLISTLLMTGEKEIDEKEIDDIAQDLMDADIIGFSSMTGYAHLVKQIVKTIKKNEKRPYLIWGGIHPIVEPEDAIKDVDAICTGEGEFAFELFFNKFKNSEYFYDTAGFWFNTPDGVQKNPNLPLMTNQMMSELPFMVYQDQEKVYKKGQGFVEMQTIDFVHYGGVAYLTVFSIGCPLKCNYCSNTAFLDHDINYRKLRYPSVAYIINEVKRVVEKQPFISTIIFTDDSFMAIKTDVLREFATLYKQEINLPFVVAGIIPTYVREEKVQILVDAGMKRVRMGIQSGSDRILSFYKRPTPVRTIVTATTILSKFSSNLVDPAYDMILDNPVENTEDTIATLDMIYNLPRPFTLNIFSLRVLPNTQLAHDIKEEGVDINLLNYGNYWRTIPSLGNCLIYLFIVYKPPLKLYNKLKKYVKPAHHKQRLYPVTMILLRFLYLGKRAVSHLRQGDFSNLPGVGFYYWWLCKSYFKKS
ncbi:MAG: B12-binding domain-containing radical SAM protein [Magnetococcales bacterium]|nr:B12-binding domain-containing radical SAM protein [Magnetococcales bacterium]